MGLGKVALIPRARHGQLWHVKLVSLTRVLPLIFDGRSSVRVKVGKVAAWSSRVAPFIDLHACTTGEGQ